MRLSKKISQKRVMQTTMFVGLFLFIIMFGFTAVLAEEESEIQKEALRIELQEIEKEIANIQAQIHEQSNTGEGLERELRILQGTINTLQLQIRQLDLAIHQTNDEIIETEETIVAAGERIEKQKNLIASLIRQIYEQNNTGFIELVLTYDSFSDFFNRVQEIKSLEEQLRTIFVELLATKEDFLVKQDDLTKRKIGQERIRIVQESQKSELAIDRDRQRTLIKASDLIEEEYRKIEGRRKKSAAEIRNQLFVLEGAGIAINFADAYFHAKAASDLTGVRPAFLLALLQQESSWGKNVGQCYLLNPNTGEGIGKNTGNIYPKTMKPSRDVQPFLQITGELGLDPYNTLVSCPFANFGYGGAMGPAQFLPSTWLGYRERTSILLGRSANPWAIRDAFTAAAVKLASHGASSGLYNDEFRSAMIYFSGSRWSSWEETLYATPIMRRAATFQEEINILLAG